MTRRLGAAHAAALAAALALAWALVTPAVLPAQREQAEERLVVRQLGFEGNRALSDQQLAAAIVTTNSSWFARFPAFRWLGLGEKRYFDPQEFRRDVVRLEVHYRRTGYPDVTIDTLVRRTPEDVYITFRIAEGEPIRVTSLQVTGLDSVRPGARSAAVEDLPLQPGDPFNRYLMQTSADTVTNRLKNRGYPGAEVFSSFVARRETRTADVTLETSPGEWSVIGPIRVEGTHRVDSSLVRKLLVTQPGRSYSQDEVFESQRNLYRADLFRFATVSVDSARYEPGMDSVPLIARVTEGKWHRVRGALGFGTNDCFRTGLGWTSRNFMGGGRILDISGRGSKFGVGNPFDLGLGGGICSGAAEDTLGSSRVNYNFTVSVKRPVFLSPRNTISVSGFTERRSEYKVYLRQETGASIALSRESARRRLPLSLIYTLSYGRTDATPVQFCAYFNACTPDVIEDLRRGRVLATLVGRAAAPRVNNVVDPTRGTNASVELAVASKYLGSSPLQQFVRGLGDYAWYRPLGRDVVLAWRVRGGIIFAPEIDIGQPTRGFVPPEQRFYAGGPNDVRGYNRNELGPVVYVVSQSYLNQVGRNLDSLDADSVRVAAVGGNALVIGNVELRVPSPLFRSRVSLATYVDAGMLWIRGNPDVPAQLRVTPGIGVRVATPLGPARFDVAYNPYRLSPGTLYEFDAAENLTPVTRGFVLDRAGRFTFHFSVGPAF